MNEEQLVGDTKSVYQSLVCFRECFSLINNLLYNINKRFKFLCEQGQKKR